MGIGDWILKRENNKKLKRLRKPTDAVLALEDKYSAMTDAELKAQTPVLKERLDAGETLDQILPDAFALVREASTRVTGLRHFPVQVMGGIALHQGRIAEMQTGEGKTLVATLPAYLNALTGKGVHIVTVNDYLAKRDANWMGGIYEFLGLTVGVITHDMKPEDKKKAYLADITYATNNEIGFDYLRDNMQVYLKNCVQRGHNFAIVDEVDSILIDDARNPLIITQPQPGLDKLAQEVDVFVKKNIREDHYEMDEKETSISLTEEGIALAESYFKTTDFATLEGSKLLGKINSSLRAHFLLAIDRDYIVEKNEVIIIDENTGRKMTGRRYSEGLHEAVEAKEGLVIRNGSKTLATTSFQNYFRIYKKLSGMTGTALTEEAEFRGIYNLDVVPIPPNVPSQRRDEPDKVFTTKEKKYDAVVEDIIKCQETGQPVLVGTASVEMSELLSAKLSKKRIPHHVLNAKNHEKEAFIIAQAGCLGSVTISTNMAGRGTDIKLGGNPEFDASEQMIKEGFSEEMIKAAEMKSPVNTEEEQKARDRYNTLLKEYSEATKENAEKVRAAGGLRVIGTERHDARRIDNQLRGRSGRQGDVGSSCFYISVEDDLFRKFGGETLLNTLSRLIGTLEGDVIQMPMLSRQLDAAQRRSEENSYAVRKFTLEYDDVVNQQRQLIYKERDEILQGADVHEQVIKYISVLAEKVIYDNIPFDEITDETDVDYVKINTRILGTLLHHIPTEEEKELALKYINDTLALSAYILDENVKEDEHTLEATASLSEASDSLAVDEDVEEVLYQEIVSDKGQVIRIDVSKLFINPKIIQRRSAEYIVDFVTAVAVLQYCSRIREYNALMYKEIQEKDVEYLIDKSQKVIKGSDYEQAIAAFRATLEADRERWVTSKELEQHVLLTVVNKYWMDHIDNMDTLKKGIVLRGYGQRNPLVEYRLESSNLFDDMIHNIQIDTAYTLLKHNKIDTFLEDEATRIDRVLKGFTFVKDEQNSKPGRNSPCPCGSGRKYKNCCGRNA